MMKITVACALILAITYGKDKANNCPDEVICQMGWCFDEENCNCLTPQACDLKFARKH